MSGGDLTSGNCIVEVHGTQLSYPCNGITSVTAANQKWQHVPYPVPICRHHWHKSRQKTGEGGEAGRRGDRAGQGGIVRAGHRSSWRRHFANVGMNKPEPIISLLVPITFGDNERIWSLRGSFTVLHYWLVGR